MAITYHAGSILRGTAAERTGGTWTNLPAGWVFIESDTLLMYYWSGTAWLAVGGATHASTFNVIKVGSTYIVTGPSGSHSGSDARTEIQWAIDNVPADGGLIKLAPNTTFDLGSPVANGITITQSGTKRVNLMGSGHSTKIQYTGTGYAIVNAGSTSDSQSFIIGDFILDGSTKTAGRSGIWDSSIGPVGGFIDLHIRNMDECLRIENTNSRFIQRYRVKTANIGLITTQGADSAPNGIFLERFSISNCTTVGIHYAAPFAGPTDSAMVVGTIKDGNIDACALAIQLSGVPHNIHLEDLYIETGSGTHDIYIKGISTSFPASNILLTNVRGSGLVNSVANMIKVDFGRKITLDNCAATSYTDSMVYLNTDTTVELDIRMPRLESTPFLINSVVISNNRKLGTVLDRGRIGFIAIMNNASSIEGDVAVPLSTHRYGKAAVADNLVPVVVMYGNSGTADRPAVFCMSGITPVNMDAATAIGDTVTTSATSGKGKTNNNATDPKLVLGYVVQSIGAAGLSDVRIK